jgi:DNA-binding transcriptional MocR family regulator
MPSPAARSTTATGCPPPGPWPRRSGWPGRPHIPAAWALGIEAGLHVALVFGRPLDDVAAAGLLAEAGLACLPLSPFFAGPARRPGLLCGYSRLPETMARGAAELIGRITSDLMAPC